MNRFSWLLFFLLTVCSFTVYASEYASDSNSTLLESSDKFVDSVLADELSKADYQLTPAILESESRQTSGANQTIGKFPANLAKNFIYLFSRNNLYPLLEAGVASGLSYGTLDHEVQEYFHTGHRLGTAAKTGNFIGGSLFTGSSTAALFIIGRFSDDPKFKSMSYSMAQAFILNGLMTTGIKHTARRLRPDESNHRSFLSGHTSTAFTMDTVLSHYYGLKVGIPAYIASAFVGVSRLGSNVHYLSDVTAGAALGYIVGKTVTRHDGFEKSRVIWSPMVAPGSKRYGLNVDIRF
jgi:membrane-associated phospholipid phosphatase